MSGFNIIMVIAIILFARLGIRLFSKWNELKNSPPDQDTSQQEEKEESKTDQTKNK